jgi:hypothetical protein
MFGPVSGTGRAMMSSLQQAMAKGMPPDQAIQYVKSMATQGVAPLADLYAMMNQFQRLKQPQAQAPQTPPTIKDQLNMAEQQMQAQQGGIAGMQAQAPAPQPMDRGLGAIDAGRMEYPQFAGGGVVALAQGGDPDQQLKAEVQRILRKSPMTRTEEENELLRQAGEELSSREMNEDSGIAALNKALSGPFIREMFGMPYASEAEIAKGGGAAMNERMLRALGANQVTPQGPPPAAQAAPAQSAVPTGTAISPFGSFDQAAAAGRVDPFGRQVQQESAPAPVSAAPRVSGGGSAGMGSRLAQMRKEVEGRKFEEIADTFSPEEKKRIEKAISGLSAEKQDAARMAMAEAGFRMAAAASRPGASFLGSLSEGAVGGMQQYRAAQKELRQTERELNREMSDLRKYQDQVARGERTAKREFEEKKYQNILQLENQAEQIRQFNAELGQRFAIAGMQYGEGSGQNEYRRSALAISGLEPMLKAAQDRLNSISIVPPVGVKADSPEHKSMIAAAQREVDSLKAELRATFSGGSGSAVPTTTSSNIIDYSALK